jgi:hypothetical protein
MTYILVSTRTEERACERIRPASGAGGRWFESSHPDQCLQGATFPGSLFSLSSGPCRVRITSLIGNLSVQGVSSFVFRGVVLAPGLFWGMCTILKKKGPTSTLAGPSIETVKKLHHFLVK